jgi:hypothetical protein
MSHMAGSWPIRETLHHGREACICHGNCHDLTPTATSFRRRMPPLRATDYCAGLQNRPFWASWVARPVRRHDRIK